MSSLYHLREKSSSLGSSSYLHKSEALFPRYLYCGTSTASKWIDSQPGKIKYDMHVIRSLVMYCLGLVEATTFWWWWWKGEVYNIHFHLHYKEEIMLCINPLCILLSPVSNLPLFLHVYTLQFCINWHVCLTLNKCDYQLSYLQQTFFSHSF